MQANLGTNSAIKFHTLLDLCGSTPNFIYISDGKQHDVNILETLSLAADAIHVMDRGYIGFFRLYRMTKACAFFVIWAKKDLTFRRLYSVPANRGAGLTRDQMIKLNCFFYQTIDQHTPSRPSTCH